MYATPPFGGRRANLKSLPKKIKKHKGLCQKATTLLRIPPEGSVDPVSSVLVLTDTRHTATSAQYFEKIVQGQLGGATRVYASDTTPREWDRRVKPPQSTIPYKKRRKPLHTGRERKSAGPGGIMFIIGPKCGIAFVRHMCYIYVCIYFHVIY